MSEENPQETSEKEISFKEQRIRKITQMYYSRPEIQKIIFKFSENREICPRFFEGFGKRPDSFQYTSDIFELTKKGATSFHCSQEIWKDVYQIKTGMSSQDANKLRLGWDLLIDIDSKYIDYSKVYARVLINFLKFHGIKKVGIKFSGSKGFHLIIPSKAFPKEINGVQTSDMFPEWPRIITKYLIEKTKLSVVKEITKLANSNKYIKDFQASKEVMPDLILVSPRHLFRMPYSLHEKTALASVVIPETELDNFEFKTADPFTCELRDFIPDCRENEAKELIMQALDWDKENSSKKEIVPDKVREFKRTEIKNVSPDIYPPVINTILKGMLDGKKRALFALVNFFRSIGMERQELEKTLEDWNQKNNPKLHDGYIKSQLLWSYRNKIILPPNYDKEFYSGMGIVPTPEEFRCKNPVNYVQRKQFFANNKKTKTPKNKK
jgi:DNA primase catalytic subunit